MGRPKGSKSKENLKLALATKRADRQKVAHIDTSFTDTKVSLLMAEERRQGNEGAVTVTKGSPFYNEMKANFQKKIEASRAREGTSPSMTMYSFGGTPSLDM